MMPTPRRYLPSNSAPKSCGPTSIARPPKPTAIPSRTRKPTRSPSFCKRSSAAAQKGEVATSSAAIPLGTHCRPVPDPEQHQTDDAEVEPLPPDGQASVPLSAHDEKEQAARDNETQPG